MNIFRLMWLFAPLLGVGVMSAPEWPARAEMIQNPSREPVLLAAKTWQSWVRPNTLLENVTEDKTEVLVASIVSTPPPLTTVKSLMVATSPVVADSAVVSHPSTKASVVRLKDTGRVLLVGDSLMGEVGTGLRQGLPRSISFSDRHKASTGLCNKGYFDWPTTAGQAAKEVTPDWVVIHMGGNDGQDIGLNGKWLRFGSEDWKKEYLRRAESMIDQIRAASPNAVIAWIGLPAMRSTTFDGKMKIIAEQQRQAALNKSIVYLDGHEALGLAYSKDGASEDGKRKVWRADDGIHYSREGGRMLASLVGQSNHMGWSWTGK